MVRMNTNLVLRKKAEKDSVPDFEELIIQGCMCFLKHLTRNCSNKQKNKLFSVQTNRKTLDQRLLPLRSKFI